MSLGEFNTSRPEKATYRIGPLPAKFVAEKRFHFGLSTNVDLDDYFFSRDSDDLLPERYISQEIQQMAHVRIRIVDEETGEVVAEENESLADLAWSYSYTNDGKVENVRFLLFDLTPVRGHTYKLEFEIDHPDKFNIPLRLEATGGQVAIYSLL
ncbi:MAG: hypothetical protein H6752_00830 [Candidatus Omnitrophica bacterium]|nr:hypothetical protein [Candidatus Omnitrophota bacterium]